MKVKQSNSNLTRRYKYGGEGNDNEIEGGTAGIPLVGGLLR